MIQICEIFRVEFARLRFIWVSGGIAETAKRLENSAGRLADARLLISLFGLFLTIKNWNFLNILLEKPK